MLDGVSLDHMKTFIAAADEGSFSAAGRKLRRAQSVISDLVSGLEEQIGVRLFNRSGRYPVLTPEGAVLLADARGIVASVDAMKSRAKGMSNGLEPELSAVVDVFFPIDAIAWAAKDFRAQFPNTPLRLYVEALGAAYAPVLDGRASLGIVGPLPVVPKGLASEPLSRVATKMLAASGHPLAAFKGPIPKNELARHVQLVLTDRSELSKGQEFGVLSPLTWRLADLSAKHTFLLNGLGWGGMPAHLINADLQGGRLVELTCEDMPASALQMDMSAVYRADSPPGPAGRWLVETLKRSCAFRVGAPSNSSTSAAESS